MRPFSVRSLLQVLVFLSVVLLVTRVAEAAGGGGGAPAMEGALHVLHHIGTAVLGVYNGLKLLIAWLRRQHFHGCVILAVVGLVVYAIGLATGSLVINLTGMLLVVLSHIVECVCEFLAKVREFFRAE